MQQQNEIKLSVIVPTRNRAPLLAGVLHSLAKQTLPAEQFEVLVVDSGSSDNTRGIVTQAQAHLKNLHYFSTDIPGLHAARHLGMEKAGSEILVYTDDDIEAFPTWLEGVADGFFRHQATLLGGKCLPKFAVDPPRWLMNRWAKPITPGRFLAALSILDFGESIKEIPAAYVIGCNFAIRKQALLAVGGFHPDAMPAELLIYRGDGETWVSRSVAARNGKVLYHPLAAIYHLVPPERMTASYFYRRNFAEGITRSFVHLRRLHKIDASLPDDPPPAPLWRQRTCRFMKQAAMALSFRRHLLRIEKKGLRDGYRFHQERFRKDPGLQAWVLKPDWLNDPARNDLAGSAGSLHR
jgi:glucosyl-dolichyl phosphate glucuronosyltransferase